MNKADLADPELSAKWQKYLEAKTGIPVILTNTSSSKDLSHIIKEAIEIGKPKMSQLMAKGLLPRPIRAIVIGMPNVGKSSLINKLIKTSKVKVGAKAGVTRITQWVRVNPKFELLDTPGIIPMKLDDQTRAAKLAMVNSISENAYDMLEIAQELITLLAELYPELLEDQYNIDLKTEPPTLENIALARNWIISGGTPDINRCATRIMSDFRNGRIGRITLESVPTN
jgi:ribosome biogenesis GTP-binding protein YlqF